MGKSESVSVSKLIEDLDLMNYTPDLDLRGRRINTKDVNRPALQLAGYFEHF